MNVKTLFLILTLIILPKAFNEDITISSDSWMPYAGTAETKQLGYMTDIAIAALKTQGYTVKYVNRPWARAIEDSRNGKIDGLVAAYLTDAPGFIFPKKHLGLVRNHIYTMNDSNWTYDGFKSLENHTLGLIRGYSYGMSFDRYIITYQKNPDKIQHLFGDDVHERLFKKLKAKRLTSFMEDKTVIQYFLKRNPKFKYIRNASKAITSNALYIAFTPKNPNSQKYADALDKGLDLISKNGKLKEILDKYGLEDWRSKK